MVIMKRKIHIRFSAEKLNKAYYKWVALMMMAVLCIQLLPFTLADDADAQSTPTHEVTSEWVQERESWVSSLGFGQLPSQGIVDGKSYVTISQYESIVAAIVSGIAFETNPLLNMQEESPEPEESASPEPEPTQKTETGGSNAASPTVSPTPSPSAAPEAESPEPTESDLPESTPSSEPDEKEPEPEESEEPKAAESSEPVSEPVDSGTDRPILIESVISFFSTPNDEQQEQAAEEEPLPSPASPLPQEDTEQDEEEEARTPEESDASLIEAADTFYVDITGVDINDYVVVIETYEDLARMSELCYAEYGATAEENTSAAIYLSSHYVLGNNIDSGYNTAVSQQMNPVSSIIPIGIAGSVNADAKFTGTFDGQGFEIINPYLSLAQRYYWYNVPCLYFSLFANIGEGGTVRNLGIKYPRYLEISHQVGEIYAGGLAGHNEGTIEYCYVIAAPEAMHCIRVTTATSSEIAGVLHTNGLTGTVSNIYFAGNLHDSGNPSGVKYNPLIFDNLNPGADSLEELYYDSDEFAVNISGATHSSYAKTTNALQDRTNILQSDKWYTNDYSKTVTGYTKGYPMLHGFQTNTAAACTSSNPFVLLRPADLIFFADSLSQYPALGGNTLYYKLGACLDMRGVAADAYRPPTNDFCATLDGAREGGSEPLCTNNHAGSGSQLDNHCIFDMKMHSYSTVTIDSVSNYVMGLVFNQYSSTNAATAKTNAAKVKNINFVGGEIVMPALNQGEAHNRQANIGTFVSYARVAELENLHSSAVVRAEPGYMCRLYMGGIAGTISPLCPTGTDAARVNMPYVIAGCSNSGSVNAGIHQYTGTTSDISGTGGLFGYSNKSTSYNYISSTNTAQPRLFENCANYGAVTGIAFADYFQSGLAPGFSYVGGIAGHWDAGYRTLSNLYNSGDITSLPALSAAPINQYAVAGIFGSAPAGVSPVTESVGGNYLLNAGNVYANPIADNGDYVNMRVFAAGVTAGPNNNLLYGNRTLVPYGFRNSANTGAVVLHSDLLSVFAGGVTAGILPFHSSYNRGKIVNNPSDAVGTVASVKGGYQINVGGFAGTPINKEKESDSNTTYTNRVSSLYYCYNFSDLSLTVPFTMPATVPSGTAQQLLFAGVGAASTLTNCENMGNISFTTTDYTGNIAVSGAAGNSAATHTVIKNFGDITVNTLRHTGTLNVSGLTYQGTVTGRVTEVSGETVITPSENNGHISVYSEDQRNTNTINTTNNLYADLQVAGISAIGETVSHCVNNGDIKVEKNIITFSAGGANTYVSGIIRGNGGTWGNFSGKASNCINTGNITADQYCSRPATASELTNANLNYQLVVSGIINLAQVVTQCSNTGSITIGSEQEVNAGYIYVAGIASRFSPSPSQWGSIAVLKDCYNTGNIRNIENITGQIRESIIYRKIIFAGISCISIPNISNLVNTGNITMAAEYSDNLVDMQVAGLVSDVQTASGTTTISHGTSNCANTGDLTFIHTEGPLAPSASAAVSGAFNRLGFDTRTSSTHLYASNIINEGDISVSVNTTGITYNALYGSNATATGNLWYGNSSNVSIAGICAMPAVNAASGSWTLTLQDSANLGNITADLGESSALYYNVGGIIANSAAGTSTAPYFTLNQLLTVADCVNEGNISVASASTRASSSVGGIAGFLYQPTSAADLSGQIITPDRNNPRAGITNCINFGSVSGGYSTGGILGLDGTKVEHVINFGTVTAGSGGDAGGIIGSVRSAGGTNKTTPTDMALILNDAVNYGTVSGGASPGGIIGNIRVAQEAGRTRSYTNLINAVAQPFIGGVAAAQNAAPDTAVSSVYTFGTTTAAAPFDTALVQKDGGLVSSPTSIYYYVDSANAFPWRADEESSSLQGARSIAYLEPEESAVHDRTGSYPNGVYGVTTTDKVLGGYYPSDNVNPNPCDPLEPLATSGEKFSAWRETDVPAGLANCTQKMISKEANILSLELSNGTDTDSIYLRHGEIDTDTAEVVVYIIKDNFEAGEYTLVDANTRLSAGASFVSPTPDSFSFDEPENYDDSIFESFTLHVQAQDPSVPPREWTVHLVAVEVENPIIVTHVKEGVGLRNEDTGTPKTTYIAPTLPYEIANPSTSVFPIGGVPVTPWPDPEPSDAMGGYEVGEEIAQTHQNTLIFELKTHGLMVDKSFYNSAALYRDDGVRISGGTSNWYNGSGITHYRLPSTTSPGSANSYVVLAQNDATKYIDYEGTMTLGIRLYEDLPSARYYLSLDTVYGEYRFYFAKERSRACSITGTANAGSINLVGGDKATLTASGGTRLTNSTQIHYGDAPDLRLLSGMNPYDIFYTVPSISAGAEMSDFVLDSVTENPDGSREYLFTFRITAENTLYFNDCEMLITTLAPNESPSTIALNFQGNDIDQQYITDEEYQNNNFAVDEKGTLEFTTSYTITAGGTNTIYNITDSDYFGYDLYRSEYGINTLIEKSAYEALGFTVTSNTVGNTHSVTVEGDSGIDFGKYTLRAYYTRKDSPFAIDPAVVDEQNQTHTEIAWDRIYYDDLTFYKVFGEKRSYATNLEVRTPRLLTISSFGETGKNILWFENAGQDKHLRGLINYASLNVGGVDVTSNDAADPNMHRVFEIDIEYLRDVFYRNFTPEWTLPGGASLVRFDGEGTDANGFPVDTDPVLLIEWDEDGYDHVIVGNQAVDFMEKSAVRYRVYAQDTRFYQDYVITLKPVTRDKTFTIIFDYQGGSSAVTAPAVATLYMVDESAEERDQYELFGNTTVFSHPLTNYSVEELPSGVYVIAVDLPYGYTAVVSASNSAANDIVMLGGEELRGTRKMMFRVDGPATSNIVITITPDNALVPWGIWREARE